MANEFIAHLSPRDFFRESALGDSPHYAAHGGADISGGSGDLYGLVLPKLATQGYTALVPLSHANTYGTGLTFTVYLVDDGMDSADLGKVVRLGLTVKTIVDGQTTDLDADAATEATVDVTLKSTAGQIAVAPLAIANAGLDSLATGQAFALRVRRVSTHANDTSQGR